MEQPNDLSNYVDLLLIGGACTTLIAVSIVIFRALTLNTNELLLKMTAIVLAGSTLFFYLVIWLGATLLAPAKDHLTTILLCYLFTGVMPSVFLYTKVNNTKE